MFEELFGFLAVISHFAMILFARSVRLGATCSIELPHHYFQRFCLLVREGQFEIVFKEEGSKMDNRTNKIEKRLNQKRVVNDASQKLPLG